MKKLSFFLFFLMFTLIISAQQSKADKVNPRDNDGERCGTTIQSVEYRMQIDKEYREYVNKIKNKIRIESNLRSPDCFGGKIIIPVAVHYEAGVVPSGQESCMTALAENQIALLNAEIAGNEPQNSAYAALEQCFGTPIGDACVEFCLATFGHPTGYGLTEGFPAVTIGTVNFNNINPGSSAVPKDPNWAGYLNIFVGNLGGGLLGEAAGIPGDFSGEGVVINACQFGGSGASCPGANTSGSCGGIYGEGNTLIHEVGHYLGLFHIWGDSSNCDNDDGVSDTPDMNNNYSGLTDCNDTQCTDLPSTCGSYDMYMNYMSYAGDACMYMFSSGQADVIYNVATAAGWSTATPSKCAPPVTPVADFTIGSGDICLGSCIPFMDASQNAPTSWTWSFSVSSGNITIDKTASSEQNPSVCVTQGTSGVITATLSVSNSAGSDGPVTKMVTVTILPESAQECQVMPCTDWADGPFIDLNNANACLLNCPLIEAGFQVFENESYTLAGLKAGTTYTLEFCTGYNPANWEAVITIAEFLSGSGTAGTVIDYTDGCSISFIPPTDGDYIAIISGKDNCGGSLNATNNGYLTFTCTSNSCPDVCGSTFTDDGGINFDYLPNQSTDYTICPEPGKVVYVDFQTIDLPTNCTDRLEVYYGPNSSGTLVTQLCGDVVGDLYNSGIIYGQGTDECITFKFVSNGFVNRSGWEAVIGCCEATSSIGGLFSVDDCVDTPVNAGGDFNFSFDNSCISDGTIDDIATNFRDQSTTRAECAGGPTYTNQLFYLIEGKNSPGEDQDINITCNVNDQGINAVQLALYGPTNISCPGTIEPGTLIACDEQANARETSFAASPTISATVPADGSNYLVVIATDGSGNLDLNGSITLSVLPVELIDFSAVKSRNGVNLQWITATETNNAGFDILRSDSPDRGFESIAYISGNGTTLERNTYSFNDGNITRGKTYYYQLKQWDLDGNFSFSEIKKVSIDRVISYVFAPNPADDGRFTLSLNDTSLETFDLKIYRTDGKKVFDNTFNDNQNFIPVNIQEGKGVYIANIIKDGKVVFVEKLIVL